MSALGTQLDPAAIIPNTNKGAVKWETVGFKLRHHTQTDVCSTLCPFLGWGHKMLGHFFYLITLFQNPEWNYKKRE